MISDQPFHRVYFGFVQPQTGGDFTRHLRPEDGVVFGSSLGDIMEKKGNVQHLAVHASFEDGRSNRQVFFKFAFFNKCKVRDALNYMLVHRITVIHVKLHHRDNGLEFRNERRKHSQFIHPAQTAFRVAMLKHQIKKDTLRFRVVTHVIVDHTQIGFYQTHGIGVDQHPCA